MAWELSNEGICFRVRVPNEAFWNDVEEANGDSENVADAAFVDDECLVLIATSPRALDAAIQVLLRILVCNIREHASPDQLESRQDGGASVLSRSWLGGRSRAVASCQWQIGDPGAVLFWIAPSCS